MRNNVKEMTQEEIRQLGEKYCNENGFKLIDIRKLPHIADHYLRYVLAYSEKKQEYATWLFNVECGGLFYGHYFGENQSNEALEDFKNRD